MHPEKPGHGGNPNTDNHQQLFSREEVSTIVRGVLEHDRKLSRRGFIEGVFLGSCATALGGIATRKTIDFVRDTVNARKIDERILGYIDEAKEHFKTSLEGYGFSDEVIQNILHSVVAINSWDGVGTGFFITDDVILTAGHVISDNHSMVHMDFSDESSVYSIYDLDKNEYRAKELFGDNINDLGVIVVNTSGRGSMDIRGNTKHEGVLTSVGFGGGEGHVTRGEITEGFPSGISLVDDISVDHITNNIIPGDSGGPVFDENGRVAGVSVHKRFSPREVEVDGVEYNARLEYGSIEPLEDIQYFLGKFARNLKNR